MPDGHARRLQAGVGGILRRSQGSRQVSSHAGSRGSCHVRQSGSWRTGTQETANISQLLLCAGCRGGEGGTSSGTLRGLPHQLETPDAHEQVKAAVRATGSDAAGQGRGLGFRGCWLPSCNKNFPSATARAPKSRGEPLFKWLPNPAPLSPNKGALLKSNTLRTPGCDQLPFTSLSSDLLK